MTSIEDFLKEQKTAKNSVETTSRTIRKAYDEAAATLKEGKYVRLEKLDNKKDREAFREVLASNLVEPLQKMIDSSPEEPLYARGLVMNSHYGFDENFLISLVDQVKSNLTYDNFVDVLSKKTKLPELINERLEKPGIKLNEIPAAEVAKYAGITVKDPELMGLQDKLQLINYTQQQKQLDEEMEKILKKPYM